MGWTDERVTTLTKLWLDGVSATQIAKQLGGITRNGVIGKIHRLGYAGRVEPSKPKLKTQSKSASHYRKVPSATNTTGQRKPAAPPISVQAPIQQSVQEAPGSATIHTLDESMCRWPIGDPENISFTFCGRISDGKRPYCEGHCRLAYQSHREPSEADLSRMVQAFRRYN